MAKLNLKPTIEFFYTNLKLSFNHKHQQIYQYTERIREEGSHKIISKRATKIMFYKFSLLLL